MSEVYLSDNSGNRVALPNTVNPVAASGVTLDAGRDVAGTKTVVGGTRYIITTVGVAGARWLFSITGVLTTAANIEWVCGENRSIIIKIPEGVTTLYYLQKDKAGYGYMRTLA